MRDLLNSTPGMLSAIVLVIIMVALFIFAIPTFLNPAAPSVPEGGTTIIIDQTPQAGIEPQVIIEVIGTPTPEVKVLTPEQIETMISLGGQIWYAEQILEVKKNWAGTMQYSGTFRSYADPNQTLNVINTPYDHKYFTVPTACPAGIADLTQACIYTLTTDRYLIPNNSPRDLPWYFGFKPVQPTNK